ncbi:unnamed protein product, partial [Ectocarpus fasciculatus]
PSGPTDTTVCTFRKVHNRSCFVKNERFSNYRQQFDGSRTELKALLETEGNKPGFQINVSCHAVPAIVYLITSAASRATHMVLHVRLPAEIDPHPRAGSTVAIR